MAKDEQDSDEEKRNILNELGLDANPDADPQVKRAEGGAERLGDDEAAVASITSDGNGEHSESDTESEDMPLAELPREQYKKD